MPGLGELERRVMDQLWSTPGAQSVRQVYEVVTADRDLAYTTVMTVLDRLAKKGVVTRERAGRAWLYRPTQSKEAMAAELMDLALGSTAADRSAALMAFVDRAGPNEVAVLRKALGEVGTPPQRGQRFRRQSS